MNVQHMTAKIFRELTRRKFSYQEVADILILLVATYFIQIAAGRQTLQLEGVDKFAEEVKNQIRLISLTSGISN